MSNSTLAKQYIPASEKNHHGKREDKITRIIIHHAAGVISAANLAKLFADPGRGASATYCIGYDGCIVRGLDESTVPGTTGGYETDKNAVTIEVSNSSNSAPWPVSNAALASLISLCADIARRNGLGRLEKGQNLCWHSMFAQTTCPGPYLLSKMDRIVAEANEKNEEAPKEESVYTVERGDTLSGIAASFKTDYKTLAEYNNIPDPNVIHVGQRIKIPKSLTYSPAAPKPAYSSYTVKAGDSLWRIAQRLLGSGERYTEIKALNGLQSDMIYPAQVLKIPTPKK